MPPKFLFFVFGPMRLCCSPIFVHVRGFFICSFYGPSCVALLFVGEQKAMNQRASNLLDEALGLVDDGSKAWPLSGRVVLVEDRVETSAAFVLHHLVKRALSPHSSNVVVVFLALSQPFSHYDRVFRKLVRTIPLFEANTHCLIFAELGVDMLIYIRGF